MLSAMSSHNWREVYRASGVLQQEPQKRRNLRAALKARYRGRAESAPQRGGVHPTTAELVLAVQNLKARLCAGLAMEDAMVMTETMSPAEKLAIELWFGMDV